MVLRKDDVIKYFGLKKCDFREKNVKIQNCAMKVLNIEISPGFFAHKEGKWLFWHFI